MKRIIFYLFISVMLQSCFGAKKMHREERQEAFIKSDVNRSNQSEIVVDTSRKEMGKITITEIEFFPDTNDLSGDKIKSIKQTTIESSVEQNRQHSERQNSNETEIEETKSVATKNEDMAPAPDPKRWRFIFYIIVTIAGLLLYLKRMPVINWIKNILSGIRKII